MVFGWSVTAAGLGLLGLVWLVCFSWGWYNMFSDCGVSGGGGGFRGGCGGGGVWRVELWVVAYVALLCVSVVCFSGLGDGVWFWV